MIGPNCVIGSGVRLKDCTLIGDITVGKGSYISNTIISWKWQKIYSASLNETILSLSNHSLSNDIKLEEFLPQFINNF